MSAVLFYRIEVHVITNQSKTHQTFYCLWHLLGFLKKSKKERKDQESIQPSTTPAEILGIMIRNNMNISGIIINDKEHKLSQYADDTLFLLDRTSKSLNATPLNVLYVYSQFSGLKVNFEKTHAVWIGVNKYSTASIKTR